MIGQSIIIQKEIKTLLVEQELWSEKEIQLVCAKIKCIIY